MKPFSLLIKPASASCNLSCKYCFYLSKSELLFGNGRPRMDDALLEHLIRSYMSTEQPVYSFNWQGGEPTLMGLEFFKQVVAYQKRYCTRGKQFSNGLQTNGTTLTDEWANFLTKHRFLVGVSLDGPKEIHNVYRKTKNDKGSYEKVIKGIESLKRYNTEFNILTLVSQSNVDKPLEIYRYLRDERKCLYHQYIECVEFDHACNLTEFSITGQQWGDFLCTIFDEWIHNDTNRVSVRLFDSIITTMLNRTPTICSFGRDCRHYLAVEHNGDVYPCDFYVEEDMKLGNIMRDEWEDLLSSPKYERFGFRKKSYGHKCNKCPFVDICAGDCQKNRLTRASTSYSESVLCEGWKQFYEHSMPSFRKLVKKLEHKQSRNSQNSSSQDSFGRNDPCPCGSGRKYKKCCMNN